MAAWKRKMMHVFSTEEAEFLVRGHGCKAREAEDVHVTIIPRVDYKELRCISVRAGPGTYGPFKRKQDAVVPLWLAIRLRSDHKADIVCPPWLTVEALRAAYARETSPQNASTLTMLPVFYLEIASLLFKHAADNIADAEQARQLVKDLEEVRAEKLRRGRSQVIDSARAGRITTVLNLNN
ncbi:GINS2, partial [Symbiodinium sp. KB8]